MGQTFVSFAQNGEDVVLWRALGHVRDGFYVDVGANDPSHFSVTKAFYDRGWSGVTVEPMPVYAAAHRRERPRDVLFEGVAADSDRSRTLHTIDGSGLSTLRDDVVAAHRERGFHARDIEVAARSLDDILTDAGVGARPVHIVVIDVEGAEAEALRGLSLDRWRPWVLVVESTTPLSAVQSHDSWEPAVLAAGYVFCLFDGLSRFYVAAEHAAELLPALSVPASAAGVVDDFVRQPDLERGQALERARADAIRWRGIAIEGWAAAVTLVDDESRALRQRVRSLEEEITALHLTVSWRLTAPLRRLRKLPAAPPRR